MLRNGIHLAVLSAFAIARQYLEPLAEGPDFFIERGATGLDVVLFALGLVLLPPALLLLAEWLASLASLRLRDGLHLFFMGGLAALLVWQALVEAASALEPRVAYALALAAGAAAVLAYRRAAPVRTALTVLAPTPLVVLALFLVFSPVRALVFGGEGHPPKAHASSGAPVVMVVLDEFPVASLMDRRGRIDAARYPSFARFARQSTWYRNAASVADYTQLAVPAILTGKAARPGDLQVAAEHPDNLFTLLGASYRLDVFEALTELCRAACPDQRREPFGRRMRSITATSLERIPALPPSIRERLADALAPQGPPTVDGSASNRSVRRHILATQDVRFARFLDTLGASRGRTLHFLHLILPHRPWRYLPSGQRYTSARPYREGLFGRWPRDPWVVAVGWQRHLLQVQFVDRLLGRLVRRLKATGRYDRSLIVITADHGASFRPGDHSRILTRTNVGDVAPVPLFVKAPGQRRGSTDDADVETRDILPTIAGILGVRVTWRTEGRSAGRVGRRRAITVYRQDDGRTVVIGRGALERRRDATVRRKLTLFDRGLFAIGPHPELAGRPLAALAVAGRGRLEATLDAPGRFRSIDPQARTIPVDVSGELRGGPPRRRAIAVAVNRRVATTAWTIAAGGGEYYTALIPPSALRPGENLVEPLAISKRSAGLRLTRLTR